MNKKAQVKIQNANGKKQPKVKTAKPRRPKTVLERIPLARGQKLEEFEVKNLNHPKHPGAVRIRGHEYLGSISTTSGSVGLNLFTQALNPLHFPGTRLEKYGQLYDKFLFRRMKLHYTSADPATATGQYILAYDRDYADDTPSADAAGIRKYFAMMGSKISNVWADSKLDAPLSDDQDFYYTNYTGYEGRIVFQGQVYVAAVSGTAFHGSVWVEYDIEMYDPSIEEPATEITAFNKGGAGIIGALPSFQAYVDTGPLNNFYMSPLTWLGSESLSEHKPIQVIDPKLDQNLVGEHVLKLAPGNYMVSLNANRCLDPGGSFTDDDKFVTPLVRYQKLTNDIVRHIETSQWLPLGDLDLGVPASDITDENSKVVGVKKLNEEWNTDWGQSWAWNALVSVPRVLGPVLLFINAIHQGTGDMRPVEWANIAMTIIPVIQELREIVIQADPESRKQRRMLTSRHTPNISHGPSVNTQDPNLANVRTAQQDADLANARVTQQDLDEFRSWKKLSSQRP